MAKPFENSDTSHLPFVISDPSYFSITRVPASRKHPRGSDDDPADIAESHKTRRVNPQRLAARLGAELVAEMEALIYPGAKMPTFEVRRVIQERYAVDRRHIYDYFHSRGLRVAKEDKHTNLTRGRLSKALARQLLEKPGPDSDPTKVLSMEPQAIETPPTESQLGESQQIGLKATPVKLKLKFKLNASLKSPELADQLPLRSAKRVASEKISGLNLGRRRHTLSGETSASTTNQHVPPKPRRRLLPVTPISADVHPILPARTPSPCPEFALLDGSPGSPSNTLHFPDFHPSSEFFFDQQDITNDVSLDIFFDDYEHESLASIEEHRPLNQVERLELYNLINNNIDASGGIEECAGTYRAYMKERVQHYFDRVSFKASSGTRVYRIHQGELHSSTRAMGDDVQVDFQKWLSPASQQVEIFAAPQLELEPGKYLAIQHSCTTLERSPSSHPQHDSSTHAVKGTEPCLHNRSTPSRVLDNMKKSSLGNEAHSAEAEATGLHYENDNDLLFNPFSLALFDGTTEGRHILATPTLQSGMFYHRRSRPQPPPHVLVPSMEAPKRPMAILDPNASSVAPLQGSGVLNPFPYSPDHQNAIRSGLYVSRPTRLRTTSAGGGI